MEGRAQVRDLGLQRRQRDAVVAVDQRVQALERDSLGVHREQGEDLGLPTVEQQPQTVEVSLGGPEQSQRQAGDVGRLVHRRETVVLVGAWHRLLDQPRHHPRGGQADRVGAVPGRRQVDDAELSSGHGVVDGRRPAHPVVHDRGVVLGGEDHRRPGRAVGQVEGVGADALVVPAAAGHEVHRLGLATHHPAAVRPEDPGVGIGHGEHQVAVLGGAAQLLLDARDGDLQRRTLQNARVSASSASGACAHVGGDGGFRAFPRGEDLGAHQRLRGVAVLDERRPRPHRG